MKKFILGLLLFLTVTYGETVTKLEKEFLNMSNDQIAYIDMVYNITNDLELTYLLSAIAWQESNLGKYLINLSDGKEGSFGIFQIQLHYLAKDKNIKSSWEKSRLAERLLNDHEFSAREAAKILSFFMKNKNCKISCALAKYNAGNKGNTTTKGKAYASSVMKRVAVLRKHYKTGNEVLALNDKPNIIINK